MAPQAISKLAVHRPLDMQSGFMTAGIYKRACESKLDEWSALLGSKEVAQKY